MKNFEQFTRVEQIQHQAEQLRYLFEQTKKEYLGVSTEIACPANPITNINYYLKKIHRKNCVILKFILDRIEISERNWALQIAMAQNRAAPILFTHKQDYPDSLKAELIRQTDAALSIITTIERLVWVKIDEEVKIKEIIKHWTALYTLVYIY